MPTQVPNSGYSATPFEEPIALKPFLKGIADAIREKKKTTELINAQNFRSEILSIKGGLIEVTELPEVGKANTVYKLVNKIGTAIPTTGTIENYYLNVSLSINKVVDILSQLTYQSGTDANTNVVFQTDNHNIICYQVDGAYAIKADNAYVFASNLTLAERLQCSSIGWNVAFITEDWTPKTPVAVNETILTEEDLGMPIGAENDKVINLFSITPFEEKIPSEMYYLFENSEWQQISGGILEVNNLPTSGEDNYVYKLSQQPTYEPYINMEGLGVVSLKDIAQQNGATVEIVDIVDSKDQLPTENIKEITSDSVMYVYYVRNDNYYMYGPFSDDGSKIWFSLTEYFEGMPFKGEVTNTSEMTELNSLYTLVSGGEGVDYYMYENSVPTQVPNSGAIENLYFNTKLSIEEVDNILSQLTYDYDGYAYVVGAYEKGSSYGNIIIVEANAFTQGQIPSGYIIGHMHDTTNMASTEFIYVSNQGLVDLALTLGINTKVGWNMETLNLNQTFIGHYGTENDKLINVVSTTPYPHWNKISGGGGIVEVTELPEVGKANTVYKLIHKNVGTEVPTTGLIENVYLNTSLSIDEVNAILKTIEYIPATNEGEPDIYIVLETLDSLVRIFDYNNGSYAITVGMMNVAYVSDESFASAGVTFVGWNPDLTNPCVVNQESTFTDDFVSQNDKLTDLFSITPFEAKEEYYLYENNEWVKISGSDPNLQEKEITENGEYVADEGYDGFSKVTVNVKGVELNPVTNIALNSSGLLTWDAPDTTDIADKLVSISYVINFNGTELTSDTNSVNVKSSLVEGDNTVSVKAIVSLYNEETQSVVEYEIPQVEVITLSATMPKTTHSSPVASYQKTLYVFNVDHSNMICKFDTATETVTTLSATTTPNMNYGGCAKTIGTNIYIFGGNNSSTIFKFDTATETVTTLSATMPNTAYWFACNVDKLIYLLSGNGTYICKFDTETETVTTLDINNSSKRNVCCNINNKIYWIDGYTSTSKSKMYKFDTETETISDLGEKFTFAIGGPNTYASIANDKEMYIFGYGNSITIYKFDTETETVTTLDVTLNYSKYGISCGVVNKTIYLIGGRYPAVNTIMKITNLI